MHDQAEPRRLWARKMMYWKMVTGLSEQAGQLISFRTKKTQRVTAVVMSSAIRFRALNLSLRL